ncbi:PilZ domain-containing protein [Thiovibrio sp. JS02]
MRESLNRRQSVRITDRVLLAVNPVSPEKLQSVTEDFHHGISLYNQEKLADIQMFIGAQTALVKLRERDADLADFLQHLDNKMNMVLQRVKKEKSPLDALVLQKANISANGIAFQSDTPARLDDVFEVHVVLLPAYIYVYCFGRVVSCEAATDEEEGGEKFRIALEYALLTEEDREKIVQHNFKQQSLALRNRRLNS